MSGAARSANFSSREVEILMELVGQYKHIIDCKKISRVSVEEKIKAWRDIEREFNTKSGQVYRKFNVLKKKHENMKKLIKKQHQKRALYGLGGGPTTSSDVIAPDLKMNDCIVPKMEPIEAVYDVTPDITEGTSLQNEEIKPDVYVHKESTSKPRKKTKWNDLASASIQLIQETMKLMKEKHKKEMELMDREYVEKLKMMREKYLLEVKVLQTKLEINKRQLAEK